MLIKSNLRRSCIVSTVFFYLINSTVSWEDASGHMLNSQNHLEQLQFDTIQRLSNSDDNKMRNYAKQFDLTRSEPIKVITIKGVSDVLGYGIIKTRRTYLERAFIQKGGKLYHVINIIIIMLESLSCDKYREHCKVSPDNTLCLCLKERQLLNQCKLQVLIT